MLFPGQPLQRGIPIDDDQAFLQGTHQQLERWADQLHTLEHRARWDEPRRRDVRGRARALSDEARRLRRRIREAARSPRADRDSVRGEMRAALRDFRARAIVLYDDVHGVMR